MPGRTVSSLHQAVAMLGYARLVKWLVLLLVIASKTSNSLPIVYTAVVRGFAMEYLEAAAGAPRARQDEGFVVGAFSLLDAMTGQALGALLSELTLPQVIGQSLLLREGPHAAFYACVLGLEGELGAHSAQGRPNAEQAALDATPAAGAIGAGPLDLPRDAINGALLQALAAADALLALI
jgi:EAL and modified HD-GYP domain-containing signal transduction protein